jgi:hypothetical protein
MSSCEQLLHKIVIPSVPQNITFKLTEMKNVALLLVIISCFQIFSCKKDSQSEKFKLLTGPTWQSDSLLENGADAGGPGGLLEHFKGDVKFNTDYTGNFGSYKGTWRFAFNETQLVLSSDSLPIPLTAVIAELTSSSLKVTTSFPVPPVTLKIRMTFKAK